MATVDILVPSPLSAFNAAYSSDSLLRMMYSADADDGYSSPDDREVERVSSPPVVHVADELAGEEDEIERVRKQVEWYFSDENLQKDSFLMKHITRNKQGYVSLKLIASLRKVKSIAKDWKVVLTAVQESSLLQVNEEGTKIRRIEAAPKVDYSHLPKTLLVTNYPHNNPDEADVRNEFSRYGNISNVLFLQPGRAIPLDIKSCRSKFPAIGTEFCILVEYKTVWEAKKTFKELSQNWRQTMVVQLLLLDTSSADNRMETLKATRQQKLTSSAAAETRNIKVSPPVHKTARHRTPNGYDSGYTRSPSLSPMPSPGPSRKFFSEPSSPPQQSRLVLVRTSTVPVTIMRLPHGPDSTIGFH